MEIDFISHGCNTCSSCLLARHCKERYISLHSSTSRHSMDTFFTWGMIEANPVEQSSSNPYSYRNWHAFCTIPSLSIWMFHLLPWMALIDFGSFTCGSPKAFSIASSNECSKLSGRDFSLGMLKVLTGPQNILLGSNNPYAFCTLRDMTVFGFSGQASSSIAA